MRSLIYWLQYAFQMQTGQVN